MKQPNISEMDVQSLKALAYDVLAIIQQQQNNLQAINAEIAKKSQAEEGVVVEEKKK